MKKSIYPLLMLAILSLSNLTNAQILQWATQSAGSGAEYGHSICLDTSGNVYTTGYFEGTVDFDPGVLTFNLISAGFFDIFVSKSDAAGNFMWAKQMGGTSSDNGYSISLDAFGNVYTTGSFYGIVDFDPGSGTFNLNSPGSFDIFISKLDAAGNFIWAKQMGGPGEDVSYSISLDASANVYTTGYLNGTAEFNPGPGTFNLISAGGIDIFISKLDSAGNFVWVKQIAGTFGEIGNSIAIDALGYVYTTGSFTGTVDFEPGPGTFNLSSAGDDDIFISKLDNAGNFVWAKQMGGTDEDISFSISLDSSGNVYTTGYFEGTVDFDPGIGTFSLTSVGGDDIFISKLDSAGNFRWAKQMGGANFDGGNSIGLDASGNVYTTGYFEGIADFDPGVGSFDLTSAGFYDIFISKLDTAGNFVWAKQIGGTRSDNCNSIILDAFSNIYTTGSFMETVNFNPGAGTFNLTSAGNSDVFILKLNDATTGVSEAYQRRLRIYPNPTKNVIYFSSPTNVQLSNLTGQVVATGNSVNILDLSEQPAGFYIVTLSDYKGQVIQKSKIVKE